MPRGWLFPSKTCFASYVLYFTANPPATHVLLPSSIHGWSLVRTAMFTSKSIKQKCFVVRAFNNRFEIWRLVHLTIAWEDFNKPFTRSTGDPNWTQNTHYTILVLSCFSYQDILWVHQPSYRCEQLPSIILTFLLGFPGNDCTSDKSLSWHSSSLS
jgi:hypothetical protein